MTFPLPYLVFCFTFLVFNAFTIVHWLLGIKFKFKFGLKFTCSTLFSPVMGAVHSNFYWILPTYYWCIAVQHIWIATASKGTYIKSALLWILYYLCEHFSPSLKLVSFLSFHFVPHCMQYFHSPSRLHTYPSQCFGCYTQDK